MHSPTGGCAQVNLCARQCPWHARVGFHGAMQGSQLVVEAIAVRCAMPPHPTAIHDARLWQNSPNRTPSALTSGVAGMATVEHWGGPNSARAFTLEGARFAVGSDPQSADLVLDDATVSAVHVVFERIGATWLLRDLGSRNGTRLNGASLSGQTRLRHGDTINVGRAMLTFRESASERRPITESLAEPPPDLTKGERRVLVELCRPLLEHHAFQAPASVREIATRLYVGKNAVQAHLINLYDKFGIYSDAAGDRRTQLANEAVRRGAVSPADLAGEAGV